MPFVFINGQFTDDPALLPVTDRGLRFGDGVFETIAVHAGAPYQWPLHTARLRQGLTALRIPLDITPLPGICRSLVERNGVTEGLLRIIVTRGGGSRGYLPVPTDGPTLIVEAVPRPIPPDAPVRLWLTSVEKPSPKALPVQCKTLQGLNSTLARIDAADHGCFDALQLNAAGELTESSSANLFWLQENILHTPALECGVLDGTTRRAVLRLSPWPVREGHYPPQALARAQAVFLTNVAWGVLAAESLEPLGLRWPNGDAAARMAELLHRDIATTAA